MAEQNSLYERVRALEVKLERLLEENEAKRKDHSALRASLIGLVFAALLQLIQYVLRNHK